MHPVRSAPYLADMKAEVKVLLGIGVVIVLGGIGSALTDDKPASKVQPSEATVSPYTRPTDTELWQQVAQWQEPEIEGDAVLDTVQVGLYLTLLSGHLSTLDSAITRPALRSKANAAKAKYAARLKARFPKLRKAYGKALAQKLWRSDIYVEVTGGRAGILNLTGGAFAANANKEDMTDVLRPMLYLLHFTEVRYRWYKGADEYTYYKLSPMSDGRPI